MADDDLHTRLTLLERTAVSRELLVEREEKLLDRIEVLLNRHQAVAADDQKHALKVFGHEIADQFRVWADKIHAERDEMLEKRDVERKEKTPLPPAAPVSPIRAWLIANWMWAAGILMLVVILRPDLASAAVKAVL